jgi:hypothetical protein
MSTGKEMNLQDISDLILQTYDVKEPDGAIKDRIRHNLSAEKLRAVGREYLREGDAFLKRLRDANADQLKDILKELT